MHERKLTVRRYVSSEKRLSNHSVRKTVVRKLKAKGVPTITAIDKNKALKRSTPGTKTSSDNIIDGKEIHFNQTTSRVPLQPLLQSTAAVSSGHVYNFHNCNVVINQGRAGQAGCLENKDP